MKNIDIALYVKKIILLVIGVAVSALGVSLFYALNIGTDPISVFVDGLHSQFNLDFGTITLINNSILIIFGLIFARKYLHIGTVIGGLVMGPFINIFLDMFKLIIVDAVPYMARFVLLFPAVALLGLGIALVISLEFGVGSMDLLTLTLRDVTKINLRWIKIALDFVFTVIGFILGGVIGAGTVVGVLLTGPVIGFALPRFKKLFSNGLRLKMQAE
jgi:uncharacterized membrane protein YczE